MIDWRSVGALVVVLAIMLALAAWFGHVFYGDWTCGMPGVHCRKVVP